MCETCGCGDPEVVPIEIQESLLATNDRMDCFTRINPSSKECSPNPERALPGLSSFSTRGASGESGFRKSASITIHYQ